jgi:hypothetical protein
MLRGRRRVDQEAQSNPARGEFLLGLVDVARDLIGGAAFAGVVRKKLGLNLVSEQTERVGCIASRMAKLHLQPRTGLNRRPDAMQKKRRNGRASTKTSVEDEIAHLRGFDQR